mmetsp:Transcript_7776/g.14322  ORF Transcript_7776/g.14322 Transcript_7776/m.14322 type:complete len:1065 (+) Transcript_7776:159-3353(+)
MFTRKKKSTAEDEDRGSGSEEEQEGDGQNPDSDEEGSEKSGEDSKEEGHDEEGEHEEVVDVGQADAKADSVGSDDVSEGDGDNEVEQSLGSARSEQSEKGAADDEDIAELSKFNNTASGSELNDGGGEYNDDDDDGNDKEEDEVDDKNVDKNVTDGGDEVFDNHDEKGDDQGSTDAGTPQTAGDNAQDESGSGHQNKSSGGVAQGDEGGGDDDEGAGAGTANESADEPKPSDAAAAAGAAGSSTDTGKVAKKKKKKEKEGAEGEKKAGQENANGKEAATAVAAAEGGGNEVEEEEEEELPYHAEEAEVALRALTARMLDPWGHKVSLDLVLLWPCTVETVKRKLASQVGFDLSDSTNPDDDDAEDAEYGEEGGGQQTAQLGLDKMTLVLSNRHDSGGKLRNEDVFPEEGLHREAPDHAGRGSVLEQSEPMTREELEAAERERRENPPYHTAVWGVVSEALPGSPGPPSANDDGSLFGSNSNEPDTDRTYDDDESTAEGDGFSFSVEDGVEMLKGSSSQGRSRTPGTGDRRSASGGKPASGGRRSASGGSRGQSRSKKHHKHHLTMTTGQVVAETDADNSLSMSNRKKNFDLERELLSVGGDQHLAAVEGLGVYEFTSFATLTVDELNAPGLGIPRPAQRRIAALAKVYQDQMKAEESEREAAKLMARQGRMKKKTLAKLALSSDVEEGWVNPRDLLEQETLLAKQQKMTQSASAANIQSVRGSGVLTGLSKDGEDGTNEDDTGEGTKDVSGKITMDGKYFFVSKKDLSQAWKDADLVFRAGLPGHEEGQDEADGDSLNGGSNESSVATSAGGKRGGGEREGAGGGDFSSVDGGGAEEEDADEVHRFYKKLPGDKFQPFDHPVNSIADARPRSPQTVPHASILDAYMQKLLRPPSPEPPPPTELRPHGVASSKLMAAIRRRCARDDRYEIPKYLDAQPRSRKACCVKHGNRCAAWRRKKQGALRRAVANNLDDAIGSAAQIGHGHVSKEALVSIASACLGFFHVQMESALEEKETVERILVKANPSGGVLGFQQRIFEEAVADLVETQFAVDNPVLAIPYAPKLR